METKEQLLEELMDIVENLDRARDLKLIGGLPVLVTLLSSKYQGCVPPRWSLVSLSPHHSTEVQQLYREYLRRSVSLGPWPFVGERQASG